MTRTHKSNNILLTGATGFLGSQLLRRLLLDGFSVFILKRSTSQLFRIEDLLDQIEVMDIDRAPIESAFMGRRIDTIIHCATDYGRKKRDPSEVVEANLLFPLRLLHAGLKAGVKTFINTDTLLDKRISPYSLSKRQFSEWLKTYSDRVIAIDITLEHFFGPLDDKTKFVSMIVDQLLTDAPEIQLTDGYQKRDFVYIDDVVSAFITLIDHSNSLRSDYYRFEVGSGNSITIRDLLRSITELVPQSKTRLNWGALEYRTNEVMNSSVNIEPLSKLGWKPQVSLSSGLAKMIETEKGYRNK